MAIYDSVNTIKTLEDSWENKTGREVEDFITRQFKNSEDKSIARFEFFQADNSTLRGYNVHGEEVCSTQVINATPIYVPELEIVNIRINSNNNDVKTGQNIELNQPAIKKIEVGVKFVVKYEILGTHYYAISPQAIQFHLGGKSITKDRIVPNAKTDIDAIQYIDITDLFTQGILSESLTATCSIGDQSVESAYLGEITVKKITLEYINKGYIEGTSVSFNISGLTSSEISKYRLVYLDNGSLQPTSIDLSVHTSVEIPNLTAGTHQLYARIEYKSNANLFYSNWVQTNVIVDCNNLQGAAVAVINSVPTTIHNCSNALLYKICYASGTSGGDIVINSYISENYDDFVYSDLKTLTPFNSTTLTLMGGEEASEKEFYSFFELETVGSRDSRFIAFTINDEIVYSYEGDGTSSNKYFTVDIVENPYNVDSAFNHVPGALLDFSQINGSGSNVFESNNIQLQPGDGWGIDGKYTAFQVSASGQPLFKNPIDCSSYLNNGFTFEFLVRTYNVNGDDYILKLGNILLGPGYVRVYEDEPETGYAPDGVFINSKADFQKDAITHILVTYSKGYLPTTYMDTYNQLLKTNDANYQTSSDVRPYNVLKIFINGVINREIQLVDTQLKENGSEFNLQIYPTSSDLKLYGLRAYTHAFTYKEVEKNYISSLLEAGDKKAFYDKNDILDESGQISLRKCINKYNVLVYAIPTEDAPLYYGNKSVAGDEKSKATLLIHYADPELAAYNGRMWGGKYKAQGSSAKKYLIHNCQYNIKKGKFLTEAEILHNSTVEEGSESYVAPRNYYTMPQTDIKAKKFVGKVNYASSMQTHKQGACNTYDDTYKSIFASKLDQVFPLGTGRKTCIENEFLYFYYNITPEQDLSTITIQDTLDNAKFMGFQTWGSAKADDPTYGYDSDITPEYVLFEGADNGNPGANFKVPWAAFQTYNSDLDSIDVKNLQQQPARVTKVSHTKGLLISDETIKYGKDNDPLDVDYGVTEGDAYNETNNLVFKFTEEVETYSLPRFVEFYNAMYQYDFTCLVSSGSLGISGTFDTANTYGDETISKKIYISSSTISVVNSKDSTDTSITSASRFDVFRWDSIRTKWVPAGLHYSDTVGGTWDRFNLIDQYKDYTNTSLYKKYETTGEIDVTRFGYSGSIGDTQFKSHVLPAMKDMFICACKEYTDVDDIAFHQAMIRVLSGTDNRAKNTYFQIIGKLYENGVRTDKGDYKVRLMQDDLDTILATDNNGQQNKSYYLLEPAFNKETEGKWGDDHSSLFYPFDLCFADKINLYTGYIIDYLLGGDSIESTGTNLYKNFLRIQKYFPAIAYNHTAEIYYELAQTIYQDGTPTFTNGDFKEILNKYVNNSVKNPLSLSHGSSYEGEVQFLKDRLLLLATLTGKGSGLQTNSQSLVNVGTPEGNVQFTVQGNAKYVNYFYPNYTNASNYSLILSNANTRETLKYDELLDNILLFPEAGELKYDKTVIKSLSIPDVLYPISITGGSLTGFALSNADKYKYLEITSGLNYLSSLPSLNSVAHLIIDGSLTNYRINTVDLKVYEFIPVIEELSLTNTTFNNTIIDFRNCNRLRKIDLSGCSNIQAIILPEGNKLTEVILPSCIKELSILNNPNLNSIVFKEGAKLTSLNINCAGIGSGFDVNALVASYFDFSNATLLKLTGNCSLDLSLVERMVLLREKVVLQGTYTILKDSALANISYSLKKSLVGTFGNIDAESNSPHFIYKSTPLDKVVYEQLIQGLEFTEGASNTYYPFDSIYFEQGNDVLINSDGTLQIEYWLDPKAPATVDSSGKVTVSGNSTADYNYKVTVYSAYYGAIVVSGQIQFGYIEPEINFYAYIDGTFSKSLITSKKLVGRVFAKRVNPLNTNEISLTILGTDTVTGILGPDYYSYNGSTFSDAEQSVIFEMIKTLYNDTTSTAKPPLTTYAQSPYYMMAQTVPSTLISISTDTVSYPSRSGKACTYAYRELADEHIKKATEAYDTFKTNVYNAGFVDRQGYVLSVTENTFDDLCNLFDQITGNTAVKYSQLMYPAFYKACLYEPKPIKTEAVSELYKAGMWYVPSIEEMTILIAHRIKSTTQYTQEGQAVLDWNATTYKKDDSYFFNQANSNLFEGFLKQLGTSYTRNDINCGYVYITSDVTSASSGNTILYGYDASYYTTTNTKPVMWRGKFENSDYTNLVGSPKTYYNSDSHIACRRDQEYTLPLCCEITLTKK